MKSAVCLVVILLPAIVFGVTTVKSCRNGEPPMQEVRVAGCIASPCLIPERGSKLIETDFIATKDVATLEPRLMLDAFGTTVEVVIPEDRSDACEALTNNSCPLSAGDKATHLYNIAQIEFPAGTYTIEFSLIGDGEVQGCYSMDVIIV